MMRILSLILILPCMIGVTMTLPAHSQTSVWKDSEALAARARALFKRGSYSQALSFAERTAEAIEKAEASRGKTRDETAAALGDVAWIALFARRPRKAFEAAERALTLAPDTLWI